MSWSIGLHLSESIIEIAAANKGVNNNPQLLKKRFFLAQHSIEQALSQFFAQNNIQKASQAKITTHLPLKIIEAGHGSPTAVLVTIGFENWLELNVPLRTSYFSSRPKRPPMLIDRELIFGISERTNAQGHIQKLLNENELEFLVSKLELNQIKNLAVCFMHSCLNPENEMRAINYFKNKGFNAYASSTLKSISHQNEKDRFWSTIMNAYVEPYFVETLTKLNDVLKKVIDDPTQIQIHQTPLYEYLEHKKWPIESSFSLAHVLGRNFAQTAALIYCGLDEFLFFGCQAKKRSYYKMPLCSLLSEHIEHSQIEPQPLSLLGRSFFSELSYTRKKIAFDPGPVVLGRGLKPTLFDLLILDQTDSELPVLIKEKITDRSLVRLEETLTAYGRAMSSERNVSARDIVSQLLAFATESWKSEMALAPGEHLLLCGPLAKLMKKYLPGEVIGEDFFASTTLLSEVTPS